MTRSTAPIRTILSLAQIAEALDSHSLFVETFMLGQKSSYVTPQRLSLIFGQVSDHAISRQYPIDCCLHQRNSL